MGRHQHIFSDSYTDGSDPADNEDLYSHDNHRIAYYDPVTKTALTPRQVSRFEESTFFRKCWVVFYVILRWLGPGQRLNSSEDGEPSLNELHSRNYYVVMFRNKEHHRVQYKAIATLLIAMICWCTYGIVTSLMWPADCIAQFFWHHKIAR